jgi:MATE family multidrug resistance protein
MVLPRTWSTEARALVLLALPLVIGNLAWSLIAATDLLLIGNLGADAVAAAALALNLYNGFMIVGMGVGMAMSPMIASERGRKPHSVRDIRRTVRQAVWAVATLCLPIWLILWHSEAVFLALGQAPDLSTRAATLMRGLQWALLPFLIFFVVRNFMGALERPIWGVIIVLATLPVNFLVGWAFIFGHLGLPALGLFGAGLASSISALFMLASALTVVSLDRGFRRYHLLGRFWVADWARYTYIWKLGLPIAITLAFEVTVFNASAFLMGLLGRAELAAHAIAIQIAALCFMVPMGIGQAATIRVGLRFGQNDAPAVARAGWIALIIGVAFSTATALVLLIMPRLLIGIFLDISDPLNEQVVAIGVAFLAVAALFQLVDSTQVIIGGALRGLHDTKVPMIFAAVGYWGIGMGVGIFLAFKTPMGGVGIWLGLALGLAVVAVMMIVRWMLRRRLRLV